MIPNIIVKGVEVWRPRWPGNWTTPTYPIISVTLGQSVTFRLKRGGAPSCWRYIRRLVIKEMSSRSIGRPFCKS